MVEHVRMWDIPNTMLSAVRVAANRNVPVIIHITGAKEPLQKEMLGIVKGTNVSLIFHQEDFGD